MGGSALPLNPNITAVALRLMIVSNVFSTADSCPNNFPTMKPAARAKVATPRRWASL